MAKRRVRLNDENDPLSSTDKVLAGFEQVNESSRRQDKKITTQQADKLTSQEDKLSTSQKVKSKKSILRKSTFQINSEVLGQLDRLHLTLQLEMGKSNAPYKEVIVEEALVRLLDEVNSDRKALIEALLERHKSRDKI